MNDFNSFINSNDGRGDENQSASEMDISSVLSSLAGKYEGASEDEIIAAIISEAEKGRRNGTLTDADIDAFAQSVAPFLNEKQKKHLLRIVKYLKKK